MPIGRWMDKETDVGIRDHTETVFLNLLKGFVCVACSVMSDSVIPMGCSPPGSSVQGILQPEYWGGLSFLWPGSFPTHGLNPGLLYYKQILHPLSHQGNPQKDGISFLLAAASLTIYIVQCWRLADSVFYFPPPWTIINTKYGIIKWYHWRISSWSPLMKQ